MQQPSRSLAIGLLCALMVVAAPTIAAANGNLVDTGHSIIRIPVFPGAKNDATKHLSENLNGTLSSVESYTTGASVDAVYAWYVAHTPGFTHHILHMNGHSTGALNFKSAKLDQSVLITSLNGATHIDMAETDTK